MTIRFFSHSIATRLRNPTILPCGDAARMTTPCRLSGSLLDATKRSRTFLAFATVVVLSPITAYAAGGEYWSTGIRKLCLEHSVAKTWQEVAADYCTRAIQCITYGWRYTPSRIELPVPITDTSARFDCHGINSLTGQEQYYTYDVAQIRHCPDGQEWLTESGRCGTPPAKTPELARNDGPMCPLQSGGSNPINISTGNKYQKEIILPGGDIHQLPFSYHYNSRPEGRKWQHTYEASILNGFDGSRVYERPVDQQYPRYILRIQKGHGQVLTFTNKIDYLAISDVVGNLTTWEAEPDVTDKLTPLFTAGEISGFILKQSDGSKNEFDRAGRLVAAVTPDGFRRTVEYDANGVLQRVVNPFGSAISFTLDGNNLIVTDQANDQYVIVRDGNGDLKSIQFPADPVLVPSGVTTRYFYYDDPRFPRHLTSALDENSNTRSTWTYDEFGRGLSSEHAGGIDRYSLTYNADGTTTVTDPYDEVRTYSFVSPHGLNKIADVSGGICPSCGGSVASRTYDDNGFLDTEIDHKGNVTDYTYDDNGLQQSRTEAFGTPHARTTITRWDTQIRKPTCIIEPDRITRLTYSAKGQVETRTLLDRSEVPAGSECQ